MSQCCKGEGILLKTFQLPFSAAVGVESDAANKVMDLIREEFVSGDVSSIASVYSGIKLVAAEEFG